MDKIEEIKAYFANRVFILDGSIEFLADGGACISPSQDRSAGESCPYCGRAGVDIAPAAGTEGFIEGGGHRWAVHECRCAGCQGVYMMILNEASGRIVICDRLDPQASGQA